MAGAGGAAAGNALAGGVGSTAGTLLFVQGTQTLTYDVASGITQGFGANLWADELNIAGGGGNQLASFA